MNQKPNRTERRRSAILDHPAYLWAIESDRPRWWAIELAASYNMPMLSLRREQQLGHRLTFTKFNQCVIKQVTPNAILVMIDKSDRVKPGNKLLYELWIPRSNIRSDDDKRCTEFKSMLESKTKPKTHLHIADWFAQKEGLI